MTHTNTPTTTSSATVRKCGLCRTPGHNRRTCPTLSGDMGDSATSESESDLTSQWEQGFPESLPVAPAPTCTPIVVDGETVSDDLTQVLMGHTPTYPAIPLTPDTYPVPSTPTINHKGTLCQWYAYYGSIVGSFTSGKSVRTSEIVKVEGREVTTRSGSTYTLGQCASHDHGAYSEAHLSTMCDDVTPVAVAPTETEVCDDCGKLLTCDPIAGWYHTGCAKWDDTPTRGVLADLVREALTSVVDVVHERTDGTLYGYLPNGMMVSCVWGGSRYYNDTSVEVGFFRTGKLIQTQPYMSDMVHGWTTPTDIVTLCKSAATFPSSGPQVYNHPALRYTVGCSITSPDNSVQEATPEQFADILLQCRDMWGDEAPVITGMRKSYLTPEDARCAMGSVSAYTSETCPTCKNVYSGADIIAHHRTHTQVERTNAQCEMILTKADTSAYVAKYATRATGCYMSESEGLADTTELSDAHVREDGMHLSVNILHAPTRKCKAAKCMQKCEDSALVYKHAIEGGNTYSCVHGTQWDEVWEQSYTHARWDHLRDSHLQEQTYNDNIGHFGQNPLFVYLWRQKHTRVVRMRHLTTWVTSVGMSKLLHTKKSGVLKARRNLTVAQAVGFETTPVGKWDGVSGSDICGLVRDTPLTLTYTVGKGPLMGHNVAVNTTCRRMAEWSGIYLTKEDMAYVDLLISRRLTGKAVAHIVSNSATPPTSRRKYTHPLTLGDTLLPKRMFAYNLRQEHTKWETSDSVPTVSNGVTSYVHSADVAQLTTLGYMQVYSHPLPR